MPIHQLPNGSLRSSLTASSLSVEIVYDTLVDYLTTVVVTVAHLLQLNLLLNNGWAVAGVRYRIPHMLPMVTTYTQRHTIYDISLTGLSVHTGFG